MGRAPCCDKNNVKRGPWSPEEDAILRSYVETYGTGGNWIALPKKAGLRRCGKSCRLRWLNYLRPDIKHGGFTDEEDEIIYNLYNEIGSRWSVIASQLPGRTDNDVKNYWNTKLKKKLLSSGRMSRMNHPASSSNHVNDYLADDNACIPVMPGSGHEQPQEVALNPIYRFPDAFGTYQDLPPQVQYTSHESRLSSSQEYSISSITNSPSITSMDRTSNVSYIEDGRFFSDNGMGQMWDFVNELLFRDEFPVRNHRRVYQPSFPSDDPRMFSN
ncbi:hypothetical protein MLD38_014667 [Melastoma candidum]|uniref:Uncharacterized protein n=1 Tax=Melastoma candidum TaxID=119954 RepID=A0ACB9REV0_9MYRT|nr:hypothetical protein MLD38_014667 [Melastoma candidum]